MWEPPGPVAAAYEASTGLNPVIIGPVGSAKTTTSVRKIMTLAMRLPGLVREDRGRRVRIKSCRVAIVCSTMRIAWKNLMPSYWKVFPKDWGKWTGGEGEPASHVFSVRAGTDLQGVPIQIDIQVDFIGIADRSLDDVTHGLELTGCYVYEWDTLPQETFTKFAGRLGRWPNMPTGAEQDLLPRQIWGDCNAFDPDHWGYDECFGDSKPPGREVFVQPSALGPNAENIKHVGRAYYETQKLLLKAWEIERLLENRFVADRPGFVVFKDYNPLLHQAGGSITPQRALPLMIGVDPGLKSAAAVMQRLRKNVWRVLAELTTPADEIMTAERFADQLNDLLLQRFPGFAALGILDPAANAQNNQTGVAWVEAFAAKFSYPLMLARSNRVKGPDGRLQSVRDCLTFQSGGEQGMLIDPSCKMILKGFNGGYRLKPMPKPNQGVASKEIEDNLYTHPQDAVQYPINTIEHDPNLMTDARGGRFTGAAGGNGPPGGMQLIF